MNATLDLVGFSDKFNDGLNWNYAAAIHIRNTIDKSVRAFNRRCGSITLSAGKTKTLADKLKGPTSGGNS